MKRLYFMKHLCITIFTFLLIAPFIICSVHANSNNSFNIEVLNEEFTLQHYPTPGKQLVIYVAPGYGFNERGFAMAKALADQGIEVWMVDLAENLFLPRGNKTMRTINDQYLAFIIEQAHIQSGKNITLFTSSYGAIPVLQGAHRWQLNHPKIEKAYLNGAILFSPELYLGVPALGVDPDFVPVTSASNIPIMIYQSEYRNNRWQLDNVIHNLEKGGATVYRKILPGITSFFYQLDTAPNTLKALREIPTEIPRMIELLGSSPRPLMAATIAQVKTTKQVGMDSKLKVFQGNKTALTLDLKNINGKRIVRNNYTGKVTVVNFWATWCPPCVKEIPSLNRLSAKMNGSNFELISVNFAEQKTIINEFLKKVNVEFPVLLDEKGQTSAKWNTIALPSTFVIGPDGKIAYGVNAAIEWDSPEVIKTLKKLTRQ
jgi:thiol-disulfide isomerase/thioredoxin